MNRVAVRYANGLYDAAVELDCVDTAAGELLSVSRLVELSGDALAGHRIPDDEKAALLRELLTGKVSGLTLEFTVMMATRHAIEGLPAAVEEFERLAGKSKVPVHLRVPYALDESVFAELKTRLIADHVIPKGAEDRAEFQVTEDKGLLGGFIAECEGLQLDASFRSVLKQARA